MNVVSYVILCWHVICVIFRDDLFGHTVFGEVKLFQHIEEPIAVSLLDLMWAIWTFLGCLGQYYGCWCPGYLHHQTISSHGIDNIEWTGSCHLQGRVSMPCLNIKTVFWGIGIHIIKMRLSWDCLIFILRRELGPSRISPNQPSWWKYAFLLPKHI